MLKPAEVVFHGMPASEGLEETAQRYAVRLERITDQVKGCRVVIDSRAPDPRWGRMYAVSIGLEAADRTIVVDHTRRQDHLYTDAWDAMRDAFQIARGKLEQQVLQWHVERFGTARAEIGRIVDIDYEAGLGVIKTSDDRRLRFERDDLRSYRFERLRIGDVASFYAVGEKDGWRARAVRVRRRRRRQALHRRTPR